MFSLRLASYLLVAPTIMGILIVALLTLDMFSAMAISIAAVAGAIIGIPIAWFVAKKIDEQIKPNRG
jgi:membrane associated rhomboid family serine protease